MSSKKPSASANKPVAAKIKTATKPAEKSKSTSVQKTEVVAKDNKKVNEQAAAIAKPVLPNVDIKMIKIKEISEVIDDISGLQAKSNKWPLLIDPEGSAQTYLRYINVNFINAGDFEAMEPDRLRRSLIGSIRYNKPFGLDIEDKVVDAAYWDQIVTAFNSIQKGLYESLMDKSILKNENYLKLVKLDIDGDDYQNFNFMEFGKFKLLIRTSNETLDNSFLNKFTVYKVVQN